MNAFPPLAAALLGALFLAAFGYVAWVGWLTLRKVRGFGSAARFAEVTAVALCALVLGTVGAAFVVAAV